jgi:hypothetical protein
MNDIFMFLRIFIPLDAHIHAQRHRTLKLETKPWANPSHGLKCARGTSPSNQLAYSSCFHTCGAKKKPAAPKIAPPSANPVQKPSRLASGGVGLWYDLHKRIRELRKSTYTPSVQSYECIKNLPICLTGPAKLNDPEATTISASNRPGIAPHHLSIFDLTRTAWWTHEGPGDRWHRGTCIGGFAGWPGCERGRDAHTEQPDSFTERNIPRQAFMFSVLCGYRRLFCDDGTKNTRPVGRTIPGSQCYRTRYIATSNKRTNECLQVVRNRQEQMLAGPATRTSTRRFDRMVPDQA